jgi:hypothetical protein
VDKVLLTEGKHCKVRSGNQISQVRGRLVAKVQKSVFFLMRINSLVIQRPYLHAQLTGVPTSNPALSMASCKLWFPHLKSGIALQHCNFLFFSLKMAPKLYEPLALGI